MNPYLLLSLILFILGIWGVLRENSLLKIFMSIEVMLASVNLFVLSLSGGSDLSAEALAKADVFVMFVWLISVAEISIVLALFILMYRKLKTVNVNALRKLRW